MAATKKVRIKATVGPEREDAVYELPEQAGRRIAASEVIRRPASAVKELIENSLDADARSIAVETFDRTARIAVTDDGWGMGRDDAMLALRAALGPGDKMLISRAGNKAAK